MKGVIYLVVLLAMAALIFSMARPKGWRAYLKEVGWRLKLTFWLSGVFVISLSLLGILSTYLVHPLAAVQVWILGAEALILILAFVVLAQRKAT